MEDKSKLAEKIVEVVNSTSNDYDAKELIEKELWDHYSGLPNPNWYDKDNWDEDHALDEVMNSMVDDIEE
ncbi:hypothetical protein N9P60_00585 [bacterium]|nr:hypothetical protein [bacterium]MDB4319738.1 hypothetical protein [bacterium]